MTVSAVPPDVVAAAAAAAKGWLRAADGNDDATIAALAISAIALAEAFCGEVLIARAASEMVVADRRWSPLAARPVAAIGRVAAQAPDGTATALSAGDYAIDIDAGGVGWVRAIQAPAAARLAIDYQVGTAATWDDVPPPVAQGIAMLVAHLFDHRDGGEAPPAAVAALWRPWRRLGLAERRHP